MTTTDICRRWTQTIAQLRQRAAKARKRSTAVTSTTDREDVLEEALVTCESLVRELAGVQLDYEQFKRRFNKHTAYRDYLLQQTPIACIEADPEGQIVAANRAAALLLNISTKHLGNRLLMHFAEDRSAFSQLLRTMSLDHSQQRASLVVRPRERAPLMVDATIIPGAPDEATTWLWYLVPTERRSVPSALEPAASSRTQIAS